MPSMTVSEISADPAALVALEALPVDRELPAEGAVRVGPYVGDYRVLIDPRQLAPSRARHLARVSGAAPLTQAEAEALFGLASDAGVPLRLDALWDRAGVRIARMNNASRSGALRNARAVADLDAGLVRLLGWLGQGWQQARTRGYMDPVFFWGDFTGKHPARPFAVAMPLATGLPPLDDAGAPVALQAPPRTLHDPAEPVLQVLPPRGPAPRDAREAFAQAAQVLTSVGAVEDTARRGPKEAWWIVPTRAGIAFLQVGAPPRPGDHKQLWEVRASFQEPERERRLVEQRREPAPEVHFFCTAGGLPARLADRLQPYVAPALERPPPAILMEMIRQGQATGRRYTVGAEGGRWRVFDAGGGSPPVALRGGTLSVDRARGAAAALNLSSGLVAFLRGATAAPGRGKASARSLALGRIFRLLSRPYQPGDEREYEAARAAFLGDGDDHVPTYDLPASLRLMRHRAIFGDT